MDAAPVKPSSARDGAVTHPLPGAVILDSSRIRRRTTQEIWLLLGVSLLASATYAAIVLLDRLTLETPLGEQTTSLNVAVTERPWLDLLYQLRRIVFLALPAFLALYLLAANGRSAARRIGLDATRPWRDLRDGAVLAALIGIPGLGAYAVGRALGITLEVRPQALGGWWWTIPVLILAAVGNALLEEVIVVGYLAERLRELQWGVIGVVAASAVLRASYHLYQGPGMVLGNAAMGAVFALFYLRRPATRGPRWWRAAWGGRVMPLVIAHTVLDVVAFVGYALVPVTVLATLGLT